MPSFLQVDRRSFDPPTRGVWTGWPKGQARFGGWAQCQRSWGVTAALTIATMCSIAIIGVDSALSEVSAVFFVAINVVLIGFILARPDIAPRQTLLALADHPRVLVFLNLLSVATIAVAVAAAPFQQIASVIALGAGIVTLHSAANAVRPLDQIDRFGRALLGLLHSDRQAKEFDPVLQLLVHKLVTQSNTSEPRIAQACFKWLRAAIAVEQMSLKQSSSGAARLSLGSALSNALGIVAAAGGPTKSAATLVLELENGAFFDDLSSAKRYATG